MKLFIKLSGLLISTFLFAQVVSAQGHPADGFYMGVDGSYDITRFSHYTVESLTDREPTDDKTIYNDEGPGAGVFIGFRQSQGRFSFAAEGRYGYSFIKNTISATSELKQTNEFSGSLLPGYWVSNSFLVFGRLGFTQQMTRNLFDGITNDHSDTGIVFGGGIQLFATDRISLRGEYNRSTFNHQMTQVFEDTTTTPSTFEQVDFTNNFRRDRFQVSLISKF
ncbi:MAG: outer membrane beta-barrel protein [Kordiimonadaceae bacterium]|nr:outer membrane beta-barrel protein [Kordiimonadaceae bacterium]MBT6033129.1 outer membrane beta-barrel protein [Kordiimonadaceae bacterium]